MRWLLLATLLLTGCLLTPTGYDAMGYDTQGASKSASPAPWPFKKQGKCQLRCTRIGNTLDCKEYRC